MQGHNLVHARRSHRVGPREDAPDIPVLGAIQERASFDVIATAKAYPLAGMMPAHRTLDEAAPWKSTNGLSAGLPAAGRRKR